MNTSLLQVAFDEFKKQSLVDYAIIDTDEYGDCNTCVNYTLCNDFGIDSKGVYLKHWNTGMNKEQPLQYLDKVFVGHDLNEEQGDQFITVLSQYFDVEPKIYNPTQSFILKERM